MATLPPPPVLLGLRDAAAAAPSGFDQGVPSKLGGVPDCIPSVTLVHPSCGICGAGLAHLVQISCPLEGSPFQRIIHVFACTRKSCWGKSKSWKVLRSQYLQENGRKGSKAKQKQDYPVTANDWCEGADDWGEDDDEVAAFGLIASQKLGRASEPLPEETSCAVQFQDLSLREVPGGVSHPAHFQNPPREEQIIPRDVAVFQPYYISVVDEEDYLGYSDMGHAEKLLQEYQQREGLDLEQLMSESYAPSGCDEKYEKSETEKRDQTFHRFMKRISVCPEQLLRYSWSGEPLFITSPSSDIETAPSPCEHCRSKRTFEFQLMPALVSMLKTKEEDGLVEFGTALVYTCEKSCWPFNHPTPLEEYIWVQEDPDQHLFK